MRHYYIIRSFHGGNIPWWMEEILSAQCCWSAHLCCLLWLTCLGLFAGSLKAYFCLWFVGFHRCSDCLKIWITMNNLSCEFCAGFLFATDGCLWIRLEVLGFYTSSRVRCVFLCLNCNSPCRTTAMLTLKAMKGKLWSDVCLNVLPSGSVSRRRLCIVELLAGVSPFLGQVPSITCSGFLFTSHHSYKPLFTVSLSSNLFGTTFWCCFCVGGRGNASFWCVHSGMTQSQAIFVMTLKHLSSFDCFADFLLDELSRQHNVTTYRTNELAVELWSMHHLTLGSKCLFCLSQWAGSSIKILRISLDIQLDANWSS